MNIPLEKVNHIVQTLVDFGILERHGAEIKSALPEFFLGKDDPVVEHLHINWRIRILNELQNVGSKRGFHFSSVLYIDKKTAEKIRLNIIEFLAKNREDIL